MPLMSLGVPNTLVRYFSQYSESDELKGFLTLMLVLPLITVIPLGIFSYGADEAIRQYQRFLSLWSDPDPELRDQVESARRALARLTRAESS